MSRMDTLRQARSVLAAPFLYGPNDGTERVAFEGTILAGELAAGATIALELEGVVTTVGGQPVLDIRWRIGPTTLTGIMVVQHAETNPVATTSWRIYNSNNVADKSIQIRALATVQTAGAAGTVLGGGICLADSTSGDFKIIGSSDRTARGPIDTTIDNRCEVTLDFDDVAANTVQINNATLSWICQDPPHL